MKYSLRSLMIAGMLGPPILAAIFFAFRYLFAGHVGAFVVIISGVLIFVILVTHMMPTSQASAKNPPKN